MYHVASFSFNHFQKILPKEKSEMSLSIYFVVKVIIIDGNNVYKLKLTQNPWTTILHPMHLSYRTRGSHDSMEYIGFRIESFEARFNKFFIFL